jgi:hypothetical protein
MVIFEKVALGRFSFLIAILFNIRFLKDSYHKCIYEAVYRRNNNSFLQLTLLKISTLTVDNF